MEKVEPQGFPPLGADYECINAKGGKGGKQAFPPLSEGSDSKRAYAEARVEGNYCYRSSSYLMCGSGFPGFRAKGQHGAIRLTAAPSQPFDKQGDGVIDDVRAAHDGHAVVVASGPAGGWRVCLDCPAFLHRVAFCNTPTKRGKPCRIAIRPDIGQTSCPTHRKAS